MAEAACGHDLIVTSGGMSVGEEDHVKAAVGELGSLGFWRLAVKPGKPVAVGHVGAVPFGGLPGNPVAVMVTFALVARPLIRRIAGAVAAEPRRWQVAADFAHDKPAGATICAAGCWTAAGWRSSATTAPMSSPPWWRPTG
ncbi:molybdopterin-binding protein [Skermanella sp. TT6]|uniref:molybdopterin-binding protein n=1 Tax=Skermanella cutis TaxID=2775420 RepID=UPI0020001C17|nr:molybdopterin-binding protein [Skermanella sp. TT6]